jgi:hypothetical protein
MARTKTASIDASRIGMQITMAIGIRTTSRIAVLRSVMSLR